MASVQLVTRSDSVAVLTLDQPGSRANVLTRELWDELAQSLHTVQADKSLRGLVIASAKPGIFIAGADLNLLAHARTPNDPHVAAFIEQGLGVLRQLESLPVTTCAAIDGAALGGGLEVALACDFRILGSNPKIRLGLPEVTLGLIPGWGGTQRLPRLISVDQAMEMLRTGVAMDAAATLAVGLADRQVKSEQLIDAAAETVKSKPASRETRKHPQPIMESPPVSSMDSQAAREAVRVLVQGLAVELDAGIQIETEAFLRLAGTPEAQARIAEFFASRKK